MRTIKTEEDGWDCVPELKEVSDTLSGIRDALYEIDNCVRKSSTRGIVTDLQETLQRALDELEYVDTEIEYETVFDDE